MKRRLIGVAIVAGFGGSVIWLIDHPPCRYVPKAEHCNDLETAIGAIVLVAVLVVGLFYATHWLKDRDR